MRQRQPKRPASPQPRRRFAELPSFRLHILAGLSERYAELRFQRAFGLRIREVRIIGVVGFHGQPSFRWVCREAELEKSHASRLVAGLLRRGLLTKVTDPDDSRSILLGLTASGRDIYHALYQEAVQRNEQVLAALTPEQRAAFGFAVEALIERIRLLWQEERQGKGGELHIPGALEASEPQVVSAVPRTIMLDADFATQLYRVIGVALEHPEPEAGGPA